MTARVAGPGGGRGEQRKQADVAFNVQASIMIDRPVTEVFAFVANFENHPLWERNFQQVERLPGPDGVGSTYRCVFKVPGRTVSSTLEITEFEPDRRIAFRADQPATARPVGAIGFSAEGARTRVTLEPRPELSGFVKMLQPVMSGYLRKNTEHHLEQLKELLETSQA